MSHPDEGTIHAWLDGALSPSESAAFEARVAKEPQLKAAVAEARGLIAASARILGTLDAVPGRVIPASRTVDEGVASLEAARARASSTRASRRWSAQRWAMAATLFLAVGIGVVYRSGGTPVTPTEVATERSVRAEPASVPPAQPSLGADAKRNATGKLESAPSASVSVAGYRSAASAASAGAAAPVSGVAGGVAGGVAYMALAPAEAKASVASAELLKATDKRAAARDVADAAAPRADELRQQPAPALNLAREGDTKAAQPKVLAAEAGAIALDATQGGGRRTRAAPAGATLTEQVPDPRASDIGCRAIRFGDWTPSLGAGVTPPAVALDSHRVAIGWRRARLVGPSAASSPASPASGTWMVQGDSVRLTLPAVEAGLSLHATIGMGSGTGAATMATAAGVVRHRATASWMVAACPAR